MPPPSRRSLGRRAVGTRRRKLQRRPKRCRRACTPRAAPGVPPDAAMLVGASLAASLACQRG
jgi:hypothetical protein